MTVHRMRGALALLLSLFIAACQGSGGVQPTPPASEVASPEPTATPEITTNPADTPAGLILFTRRGPGEVEQHFTIKTDGTGERPVCSIDGCSSVQWSADWLQIHAIGPTGHGTWSLTTMLRDGTDQAVVEPPIETLNLFVGASSADGRVVAFQGMDETDPSRNGLYIASPDLSGLQLVTPLLDGWLAVEPFGLTPDGSRIVFFVDTGPEGIIDHAGDVYVIDTDGSRMRQLNPPGTRAQYHHRPVISLSPDGTQAAFGVDNAVWVVDLEAGEARMVTRRNGFAFAVGWSPNGEWITYTRFHEHTTAIALVRPDGTEDHEITPLIETDEANSAVWAPDGKHLLVPRDSDASNNGPQDLWILDLAGTWINRVTHEPSTYGSYSWAPAPGS